MSTPARPQSLAARLAFASMGLAIAVFFGALGFEIVRAPITGHAWEAWFLRGFIFFMFGGLTAGGLLCAWTFVRGEQRPPVPDAVLARCPACGELFPEVGCACASCGQSRVECTDAWRETDRENPAFALLGGAVGASLVCLGLLLGGHAVVGDERRSPMMVVYLALALILVSFGGALVWGCLFVAREVLRARGTRRLTLSLALGARSVAAEARVERGVLHLRGASARFSAVEDAPASPHAPSPLPPTLRALSRVLAVLHARGEASLTFASRTAWVLEPGSGDDRLSRESSTEVMVDTSPPRVVGMDGDVESLAVPPPQPIDARDIVLMAIAADVALRPLAATVSRSPDLANAFETYARRLASTEADDRVIAVLGSVLHTASSSPTTPYREAV